MKKKSARLLMLGVAVAISTVAFIPASASASPSAPSAPNVQASVPEKDTTIATVPFSSSIRLTDAVGVDARQTYPVVGYRFENPQVVGEYYLGADQSPTEFVASFQKMYQTQPQVVAALVKKPLKVAQSRAAAGTSPVIETGLSAFEAPLIPQDVAQARMDAVKNSATVKSQQAAAAPLPATDWRPVNVVAATARDGQSQYFSNYINWEDRAKQIPGSFGVEVQIDLDNGAAGTRGSIVPGQICGPNFRDDFIAKNYDLNSWSASNAAGNLPAAYPYADLNDLFDSCGRNSMTIGFASPQDMPVTAGWNDVQTFIDAQVGNRTSSGISGTLQLVNSASCPFDGSIAFTDCMGIPEATPPNGIAGERKTLNADRGWNATPDRCWMSEDYGRAAPIACTP